MPAASNPRGYTTGKTRQPAPRASNGEDAQLEVDLADPYAEASDESVPYSMSGTVVAAETETTAASDDGNTELERQAATLAQTLLSNALRHRMTGGAEAPIQNDVNEFVRQYQRHVQMRSKVPCLQAPGEDPAPVDLNSLLGPFAMTELAGAYRSQATELANRLLLETAERSGLELQQHDAHDAFTLFRGALTSFLKPHIARERTKASQAPPRTPPGGPPSGAAPPDLHEFTVHTQGSGLRIFCSPTYWWDLSEYFGAPSTPVKGLLRAGTWRFGADGESLPLTWDTARFQVPATRIGTLWFT